jgi:phosphatidylserine decarboxylase
MTIHREGNKSIALGTLIFCAFNLVLFYFFSASLMALCVIFFFITFAGLLFLVSFFRVPRRILTVDDHAVVSPADGKIVVIEEITDPEYFKDRRIQVSVFMSPANVHLNRNPVGGEVVYSRYHKGKFLVAWHPKSSTDNERQSVVIRRGNTEILVKQIAGALAKRVVNYLQVGQKVKQSEEMGFIKFGSRVDLLLPPGTKVNVGLNQVVQGGVTVIATLAN